MVFGVMRHYTNVPGITQDFEAEVGGFFRMAESLVARVSKRRIQIAMETLRDLMEAGVVEK